MSGANVHHALAYARLGIPVFPCRGKFPFKDSHGFKDATTDVSRIEEWWREAPSANVAIALGGSTPLGYLAVLDIDPRKGGEESFDRLIADCGALPDTVTVLSGDGGTHFYFRSDVPVKTRRSLRPGIDFLGLDSYVVAPPSAHPNGSRYLFEASGDLFNGATISAIPNVLVQLVYEEDEELRNGHKEYGTKELNIQFLSTVPLPLPDSEEGRRELLAEIAASEDVTRLQAGCLGVLRDFIIDKGVLCPLPGHEERRPSAALHRDSKGEIVLHCFHLTGKPVEFLTLPEVYAARVTGKIRKLNERDTILWRVRLLIDSGVVEPPRVELRPLRPGALGSTRKAYDGLERLVACRTLLDGGTLRPFPLTQQFLVRWTGLSRESAAKAITYFCQKRIIREVGKTSKLFYGKPLTLFAPVPVSVPANGPVSPQEATEDERRSIGRLAQTVAQNAGEALPEYDEDMAVETLEERVEVITPNPLLVPADGEFGF